MELLKKQYVYPILVPIIIYGLLGYFFLLTGTKIYELLPLTNFTIYDEWNFSFQIKNNAVLSLPFVNPSFFVKAYVENQTNKCYIVTGKGKMECEKADLDVGFIEINKPRNVEIIVKPEGDFNITIEAHINFFNVYIRSASLQVHCKNLERNLFSCN